MNAPRPPSHPAEPPQVAPTLDELAARYRQMMRAAGAPELSERPEESLAEAMARHGASIVIGLAKGAARRGERPA